jgi:hypothetical protein
MRCRFTVDWMLFDLPDDAAELYACTCGKFLHYMQCKHALAKNRQTGLVSSWPSRRDPTNTQRLKPGRPAMSRGGEALAAPADDQAGAASKKPAKKRK